MTMTDIATRVYNHNRPFDPIVRSLLDTDFYKFLMGNVIRRFNPETQAEFAVNNRNKSIRLGDMIDMEELRAQLDYARELRFTATELVWLSGATFYGRQQIFDPEYISWLRDFQLPEYNLSKVDGQIVLTFDGDWASTSMWEIPALAIINELKSRAAMANMGRFELDVLYSRAKARLWEKIEKLQKCDGLKIAEFGTRRRHGFLWQEWATLAMREGLGDKFIGSSNTYLAFKHGLEAIGTNAHEMPMVDTALRHLRALANNEDPERHIRLGQVDTLTKWRSSYNSNLLILLPDTYGTTQFLSHYAEEALSWKGIRIDSKDPFEGGAEVINWWRDHGIDPKDRTLLFSDGLDVDDIVSLHRAFSDKTNVGFGWGTRLTNDFRDLAQANPDSGAMLEPLSLVCKVSKVGDGKGHGIGAVKISDNIEKATGERDLINTYLDVFGHANRDSRQVEV